VKSITPSRSALLLEIEPLLAQGHYLRALDSLGLGLQQIRAESSSDEWRTFCAENFSGETFSRHPLSRLLKVGPLGSGCAGTSHGQIHEPLILDVIYGFDEDEPPDLSPAARAVRSWELALGFSASLRERHQLFVRELNDLGASFAHPRVLAVGCGHLRDAAAALSLKDLCGGEVVAFDRDRACIDWVQREYRHPGLRSLSGSLRDLTKDFTLGHFDFIYLPTLLDTLEDLRVKVVLGALLPLLKPGGRLLAANFSPELADSAYLEACWNWWPRYRGEAEWAALLSSLSSETLRGQTIFRDHAGGSLFLELQVI